MADHSHGNDKRNQGAWLLCELTGNGSLSPLDFLALTDTFDSPAILRPLLALCIGP